MDSDTVMTVFGLVVLWYVGARVSAYRESRAIGTNVGILAGLLAAGWAMTKVAWLIALLFGLGVAMAASGVLWIVCPAIEVLILPVYDFLAQTIRDWRRRRADRAQAKLRREEEAVRAQRRSDERVRLAAIQAAKPPPPPPLTYAEKIAELRKQFTAAVKELDAAGLDPLSLAAAKEEIKQSFLKCIDRIKP